MTDENKPSPKRGTEECPLCRNMAAYRKVDYENRKTYTCDTCSQFQISRAVEEIVRELPIEEAKQLSQVAARAPSDSMLVLLLSTHEERLKNPGSLFGAEYAPRQSLPGFND